MHLSRPFTSYEVTRPKISGKFGISDILDLQKRPVTTKERESKKTFLNEELLNKHTAFMSKHHSLSLLARVLNWTRDIAPGEPMPIVQYNAIQLSTHSLEWDEEKAFPNVPNTKPSEHHIDRPSSTYPDTFQNRNLFESLRTLKTAPLKPTTPAPKVISFTMPSDLPVSGPLMAAQKHLNVLAHQKMMTSPPNAGLLPNLPLQLQSTPKPATYPRPYTRCSKKRPQTTQPSAAIKETLKVRNQAKSATAMKVKEEILAKLNLDRGKFVCSIKVQTGGGMQTKTIQVHQNDDPSKLALEFCTTNKLPAYSNSLSEQIKKSIAAYLNHK